jgi:hypothetical protein
MKHKDPEASSMKHEEEERRKKEEEMRRRIGEAVGFATPWLCGRASVGR